MRRPCVQHLEPLYNHPTAGGVRAWRDLPPHRVNERG